MKGRVLAAGVAYGDVILRRGLPTERFPVTPGYDLIGVVEGLGPGASRFHVGERVAAIPMIGSQQKFICVLEDELMTIPPTITPEVAVSIVLNYATAYQLLTRATDLNAGDDAFVYGLAGGLGTAVQQVAKELGIAIYGTVSKDKLANARHRGAAAFDRNEPDLVAALRRDRSGGVDAVVDLVGGAGLDRSYRLLSSRGTLVMMGAADAVQGNEMQS